jgi:hypothetical protein
MQIMRSELMPPPPPPPSYQNERGPELKIRRGLGILEELILEKNPDFFKIQEVKK